jgi:hypothetical protein
MKVSGGQQMAVSRRRQPQTRLLYQPALGLTLPSRSFVMPAKAGIHAFFVKSKAWMARLRAP